MRILINLSTLKRGGGQNVGLNFLHGLYELDEDKHSYFFLVTENSLLHQFLKQRKQKNILVTSGSSLKRIFRELIFFSRFIKKNDIDIIYTYFGFGLFMVKIPQVCGIAFSNIFFPEIKFWQGNFFNKLFRKIIDIYRLYGIKKAAALIFENEIMEKRSNSLFQILPKRTITIQPSFSQSFEQVELNISELNSKKIKILLLCGWQLNKNIMKVPEIAFFLKKINNEFKFIITAPIDNSKVHKKFLSLIKKYEVQNMISIIGTIKKQQLKSLYNQIDFVLLMSKLESFSNNIIEAWHYEKPLLVSNEEWAHSICKNAAYYINRESSKEIANSIINLNLNLEKQKKIINEGLEQIKKYPSIIEKTKKEITYIEKICNENKN